VVTPVADEILILHRRSLFATAVEAWEQRDWARAATMLRSISRLLEKEAAGLGPGQARDLRLQAAQAFAAAAEEAGQGDAEPAPQVVAPGGAGPEGARWACTPPPAVTLDDVVGLEEAKQEIHRTVIYPFRNPDVAARYGIGIPRGVLLFGPPGTGKTLLAEAIAGMLECSVFVVSGADLLSKWHGQSAQNVASLFASARAQERSMILIDELQGIAVDPDQTPASEAAQSVLAQLLQELQGFGQVGDNNVLFVAATNYPWLLPAPLIRLGRFDVHIHVPLPDCPAREHIFRSRLDGRPCSPGLDFAALARQTSGYSAADITAICLSALRRALDHHIRNESPAQVTQEVLQAVIASTRPSASPEQVAMCSAWAGEVS